MARQIMYSGVSELQYQPLMSSLAQIFETQSRFFYTTFSIQVGSIAKVGLFLLFDFQLPNSTGCFFSLVPPLPLKVISSKKLI